MIGPVPCPKCGCPDVTADAPKLVRHQNPTPTGWPTQYAMPHPEALAFRCAVCGWMYYTLTVAEGGEPWAPPRPAKPAAAPEKD